MKIEWAVIKNYKSYRDTEKLKFSEGFNVFVGQNNVGKTALIESLGLKFLGNPHKSLDIPTHRINPNSEVEMSLSLNKDEFMDLLLTINHPINIPIDASNANEYRAKEAFEVTLNQSKIEFHYRFSAPIGSNLTIDTSHLPAHGLYPVNVFSTNEQGPTYYFASFKPSQDRTKFLFSEIIVGNKNISFEFLICGWLMQRIYLFKAERLNVGLSIAGTDTLLHPDASNLPQVLNNLKGNNPRRFDKLNKYINLIFPSIFEISVKAVQSNQLEVITWTTDPESERSDLTISLKDSGTGVGQALAILYVALTSDFPTVIIIDEPNSFLHPAATRKLIEILTGFPQHQFIVSTHSPEVIKAAKAKIINLIRWSPPQSRIEQFQSQQLSEIRECLLEVGAKLSDVFGADQILWVEGPTEEEAFNLFLTYGLIKTDKSINIVAVRNTGDFEKKNKHLSLILDIYTKLSHGNALIPSALAFIFDREKLSNQDIEDIKRKTNGLVSFIPRSMYECYLLKPAAILAVMKKLPSFLAISLEEKIIVDWIEKHSLKYEVSGDQPYTKQWLEKVDAANLLKDLFSDLSDGKESFDKRLHSIEITEWLIQNEPAEFIELTDFIKTKIQ